MSQFVSSEFKLGIICGGQLGKMLGLAAANWDVHTSVLDANEDCPAAKVCNDYTKGHHLNFDAVYKFGQKVDMITFEIEHVNLEALRKLKSEGKKIFPDPELLAVIQDKGLQKTFYHSNGIPTAPYHLYKDHNEVIKAISDKIISFPFVQKSRKDGYDGKGVVVIKNQSEISNLLQLPCVIEEAINIEKELAVIVARNSLGEISCFPMVDMEFNHDANLVEMLVCPAQVSKEIETKAQELAKAIAAKLNLVGILAVEFFLDKNNNLIVNECAPRAHNSGHHTIENNYTSQFEQQIRAILGMPLGSTKLKCPAVMLNLLGDANYSGPVYYEGFDEIAKIEGVNTHIYGKSITKPFRKMGHFTILDDSIEGAKKKALKVKNLIKVISK